GLGAVQTPAAPAGGAVTTAVSNPATTSLTPPAPLASAGALSSLDSLHDIRCRSQPGECFLVCTEHLHSTQGAFAIHLYHAPHTINDILWGDDRDAIAGARPV